VQDLDTCYLGSRLHTWCTVLSFILHRLLTRYHTTRYRTLRQLFYK